VFILSFFISEHFCEVSMNMGFVHFLFFYSTEFYIWISEFSIQFLLFIQQNDKNEEENWKTSCRQIIFRFATFFFSLYRAIFCRKIEKFLSFVSLFYRPSIRNITRKEQQKNGNMSLWSNIILVQKLTLL
jgi:hypothetical protein